MSGKAGTGAALAAELVEGNKAASRSFNQTIASLKDGVSAATRGLEQAQASVKQGMEKAMSNAEEFLAFGQGNAEAALQSSQILANGLQDLSRQAAAAAQARVDEALCAARAVLSAKSVREVFDLYSSLNRSGAEKVFAETSKLADATFKLIEQAWAPITQRMTQAREHLSKAA